MFKQEDKIKILVVRFKRIGDAILSLPLCHSLKLTFPNAELDFILYEETAPLFQGHPYIDNVIVISKKESKNPLRYLKRVYSITRKKYDIIIDVMSTFKSEIFCAFSLKTPIRMGIYKSNRGFFYTHKQIEPEALNKVDKFLKQFLHPLEDYGFKTKSDYDFVFSSSDEERLKYRKLMEKAGIDFSKIVVAFSITTRVKVKMYPLVRMKEVVKHLISKYEAQIVFFYSSDQETEIMEVYSEFEDKKNIFCNVKTETIRDLVPFLENCDYYIGNEGGPRHLAQGIGIPSLAVFYPTTSKKEWVPFPSDKNMSIISSDTLDYHSLTKEQYEKLDYDSKYALIEVEMINKLADKLIANNPKK